MLVIHKIPCFKESKFMNFKKLLFLISIFNVVSIFTSLNNCIDLTEENILQENRTESDQLIYKNYILTGSAFVNCNTVLFSHIYPLIQQLENSGNTGLNPNTQEALNIWLDLYTEMKCFDQSATDCSFVLTQNIFKLIQTLQSSATGLNAGQQDALDTWISLYKKMRCFDQSAANCTFVLNNNIFPLVIFMQTGGTLSAAQQAALSYWTGIYRDMKCAGCGCTGGCTGVCPVCPCPNQN